jgi:hypothetical protein
MMQSSHRAKQNLLGRLCQVVDLLGNKRFRFTSAMGDGKDISKERPAIAPLK